MRAKKGAILMAILALGGLFAWQGLPSWAKKRDAGRVSSGTCPRAKSLPPPSYESFFGRQLPVSGESREWQVRLVTWRPSKWPPRRFTFSLKNRVTGTVSRLTLTAWTSPSRSLQIDQIDQVTPLPGDRLLILGRAAADFPVANMIALPSGRLIDRFDCFGPAISPGRRFLAFVKSFPPHPGPVSVTDEYLVYDLTRSPGYNRPHFKTGVTYDAGWPVYPPGATNAAGGNIIPGASSPVHTMTSKRLYWLGPDTLAFIDSYEGDERLVVAKLSAGVVHPRVRSVSLDLPKIVDFERCQQIMSPTDFEKWKRLPLIGMRIAKATNDQGWVCIRVSTWAGARSCLRRTNLMVKIP